MKTHKPIPSDYPVKPIDPDQKAEDPATCGHCGLTWDDAIVTSMTPAPGARCPFEPFHVYLKDFADYAESVEYRNQRESGFGGDEGEWFYGDDATLTVYTGTFANDHSPGASSYTCHDTYETRDEYDARLAELEAMPEYLEEDESDDDA